MCSIERIQLGYHYVVVRIYIVPSTKGAIANEQACSLLPLRYASSGAAIAVGWGAGDSYVAGEGAIARTRGGGVVEPEN